MYCTSWPKWPCGAANTIKLESATISKVTPKYFFTCLSAEEFQTQITVLWLQTKALFTSTFESSLGASIADSVIFDGKNSAACRTPWRNLEDPIISRWGPSGAVGVFCAMHVTIRYFIFLLLWQNRITERTTELKKEPYLDICKPYTEPYLDICKSLLIKEVRCEILAYRGSYSWRSWAKCFWELVLKQ